MIEVRIHHSFCVFSSDDVEEVRSARKALTLYYEPSRSVGLRSILLYKKDRFPTGALDWFKRRAGYKGLKLNIVDERNFNDFPSVRLARFIQDRGELRKWQEQALSEIGKQPVGLISAPTGAGKSRLILETIIQKSTNTLILCPTYAIQSRHIQDITETLGESSVTDDVDKVKSKRRPPITVICFQALNHMNDIDRIEFMKSFSLLIVDECHTGANKTIRSAMFEAENAVFRYGFSATPWRDKKEEQVLLDSAMGSNVIYDYSEEEAISEGVIERPTLNVLQAESPETFMKYIRNPHELLEKGYIRNDVRNAQIARKAADEIREGKRVFVFVNFIEHGKEIINKIGVYCNDDVLFFTGDLAKSDRDKMVKNLNETDGGRIIVGTNAFSIGVDVQSIDSVIIASWGKSSIQFLQGIGRGVRRKDGGGIQVWMLWDWWNVIAKKHSLERIKIFAGEFPKSKIIY